MLLSCEYSVTLYGAAVKDIRKGETKKGVQKMKLFEELKVGNLTLKNRVVLAPMGNTTDTSNSFNMRDINYFEERAKGGCGLLLTGAVQDRKSTRLNSSHEIPSRMPSSA